MWPVAPLARCPDHPNCFPREQGSEWKLDAAPEDDHITLMRNGTLRLHPLPILLFPSGHVAFVQRLPWR